MSSIGSFMEACGKGAFLLLVFADDVAMFLRLQKVVLDVWPVLRQVGQSPITPHKVQLGLIGRIEAFVVAPVAVLNPERQDCPAGHHNAGGSSRPSTTGAWTPRICGATRHVPPT